MKLALRTRGRLIGYAEVDPADFHRVSPYRWSTAAGYVTGRVNKRQVLLHRFLLGLEPGDRVVHHINEDKLDNRRSNLMICANASEANTQPHPKRDEAGRLGFERWRGEGQRTHLPLSEGGGTEARSGDVADMPRRGTRPPSESRRVNRWTFRLASALVLAANFYLLANPHYWN